MELEQLKNFTVIAKYESITKAAQKLHISQPSLSRSLHSLEKELGTQLFERVGRHIALNDAGRFIQTRAQDVLDSAEIIKLDLNEFLSDRSLYLDVYSPVPMGAIEDIVMGFKQQYPAISLRVASWPIQRLHTTPPGITFFASTKDHTDHNYLKLGREQVVLAVSKKNPLAQRESVTLAELAGEGFVSTLSDSPFYDITQRMFAEAGFKPNIIIEDQDYNRVMAYVCSDFGIALAPSITWFGLWSDRVVAVPISDIHAGRYLYLKWPANTTMNWAALRFREYMVNHFNKTYGFSCSLDGQ